MSQFPYLFHNSHKYRGHQTSLAESEYGCEKVGLYQHQVKVGTWICTQHQLNPHQADVGYFQQILHKAASQEIFPKIAEFDKRIHAAIVFTLLHFTILFQAKTQTLSSNAASQQESVIAHAGFQQKCLFQALQQNMTLHICCLP